MRARGPGSRADLARAVEQLRQTCSSELGPRGGEPDAGDCHHQEWNTVTELHGGDRADRRQCSGSSTQIYSQIFSSGPFKYIPMNHTKSLVDFYTTNFE